MGGRSAALLVIASLLASAPAPISCAAYLNSSEYDIGNLGPAQVQSFYSSNLTPPALNMLVVPATGTVSTNYTLWAYRGADAAQPAPLIMDNAGELVWSGAEYGSSMDLVVQSYLGEPVLTFFDGTFNELSYGDGSWFILNQNYEVIKSVTALNQTANTTDFHEFVITANNTALIEAWRVTETDLTGVGGLVDGYTFDCVFQEVDIATNTLLFEWRSLDWVPVTDSYFTIGETGNSSSDPYDYCHINSLQKDSVGNYLISMRGPSTIYSISAATGEILWRLGGINSTFTQETGAQFWYQHDARLQSEITSSPFNLTVFENAAGGGAPSEATARGLILSIDTTAMTSTLLQSFIPSFNLNSSSQGSIQPLDDGTVVVGWGAEPYWSEYALNGTLLQDVQFGSANSTVQSYRVFKMAWTGYPTTSPNFALNSTSAGSMTAYASWNGATEVATWVLMGGNSTSDLANVTSFARSGFESNISLGAGGGSYQYLAAAAISSNGTCLGATDVFALSNGTSVGLLGKCPGAVVASTSSETSGGSRTTLLQAGGRGVILSLVLGAALLLLL